MAAGSPTSRRRQVALTPDRIVAAARELVEDVGYEELSLRALARRLHVTAPALYDHFDSKADVLRAVAAQGFEDLSRVYADIDDPRAIARARRKAREYVNFAQQRPELFRVMFLYRPAVIIVEADNELPAATRAFESTSADIAQAIADGDLVERDVVQLSLTMWAGIHGVASIALASATLSEQLADDVIDAMFAGLAPRRDRP